jgi:transcriptional regulator GlxA family with amidase domain
LLKSSILKNLTFIVPNGENNLSSIVGAYKIFSKANAYWKEKHKRELFAIQLAGLSTKVNFYNRLFSAKPHTHISKIVQTDLIVIPSLNHNYHKSLKENGLFIKWIAEHYKQGAEVAAICIGAFFTGFHRHIGWKELFYSLDRGG